MSLLPIRRPSLRGATDSKGRSAVGIRGDPEEGSVIKDSLGTGFKIRSQGFVKPSTQRNDYQTTVDGFGHFLKSNS